MRGWTRRWAAVAWTVALFAGAGAPARAALEITTPASLSGALQQSFAVTLSASGGTAPLTWRTVSGSLPTGIVRAGATISGIPTEEGTFSFTIEVKDSRLPRQGGRQTARKAFTLRIGAAPPGGGGPREWNADEISALQSDLDDTVGSLGSAIGEIDGLQEAIGIVQRELAHVRANDLELFFFEVLSRAQQSLVEEQEGLEAFLFGAGDEECGAGTPCAAFRRDLGDFLAAVPPLLALPGVVQEDAPLSLQLDLARFAAALDALPGRLLFPLYRIFTSEVDLRGTSLAQRFQTSVDAATTLAESLRAAAATYRSQEVCEKLLVTPNLTREAIRTTLYAATRWHFFAALLRSETEMGIEDPEAGAQGFVKGNLDPNPEGRVAAVLAFVAEVYEQLGLYATHKMVYCAAIHQQQAVQDAILESAHPSTRRNDRAR